MTTITDRNLVEEFQRDIKFLQEMESYLPFEDRPLDKIDLHHVKKLIDDWISDLSMQIKFREIIKTKE